MPATLTLWPARLADDSVPTLYAADGTTLITAAGIIAPDTQYYRDLRDAGRLLDYDPVGTGGTPIGVPDSTDYAATAGTADTARSATVATSSTVTPLSNLITSVATLTIGATYEAQTIDGAVHSLECVAGSATIAVGRVFASAGDRHLRLARGNRRPNASLAGAVGNGTTSDRAALKSLIDSASANRAGELELRSRIEVGQTSYAIDDTIIVETAQGGMFLRGGGRGQGMAPSGARLVWTGAPNKPMISWRTFGGRLENCHLTVATGSTLEQFIDFRGGSVVCSMNNIVNVLADDASGGTFKYFATSNHYFGVGTPGVDYDAGNGNNEDTTFTDCQIVSFTHAAFRQTQGQPYKWVMERGSVMQRGVSTTVARGRAAWIDNNSSTIVFRDVFCYNLEAIAFGLGGNVVIDGCTSELVKRFLDAEGFTGNSVSFTMKGGRHAADGVANPTSGPRGIAADNYDAIRVDGRHAVSVEGVHFAYTYADTPFRWSRSYGASTVSKNNVYPNRSPFVAGIGAPADGSRNGGTFSSGDHCWQTPSTAGLNTNVIPHLDGCENPVGSILIEKGVLRGRVNLDKSECDANYPITLTTETSYGAPAAGAFSAHVENKSETGFDVVLEAVPGSTAGVLVHYKLHLAANPPATSTIGAHTFALDTVLRTTLGGAGGGIQGSASGFWVESVVSLDKARSAIANNGALVARGYNYTVGGYELGFVADAGGAQPALTFRTGNSANVSAQWILPVSPDPQNKSFHIVAVQTPTQMLLYVDGVLRDTKTSAYTVQSGEMTIGWNATYPTLLANRDFTLYAVAGGTGVPDAAAIAARFADVQTQQTLPVTWPGQTVTHRYLLDDATVTNDVAGNAHPVSLVSGTEPAYRATRHSFY